MPLEQVPVSELLLETITAVEAFESMPFELSFEKQFDVEVGNGYGMTETTALISRAPAQQPPGSVGMRIPYSKIRIVHLDGSQVAHECELGESGVILVKGPQVYKGYKNASDNANAWIEDGWFNTGDLGYLDGDEFLYLSGRAKDLIIRSGHNMDPVLIEEPLNSHPAVSTSIAVGLPDPCAEELPMAFVTLNPGTGVSEQELLSFCEEHISERTAIPKRFEVIDAMPLTAVGKIFRPRLRQIIAEKVLKELLEKEKISATVTTELHKQRGLTAHIQVKQAKDVARTNNLAQNFTIDIDVNQS